MTKSGLTVVLGLTVAAVGVIISYQQRFVSKVIEKATEAPSATATATEAPTQAPKPTAIPSATAKAWSVAFYPDNWTYQLEERQCAIINWTSTGVTDLKFGSEGSAGEKVEATGRKDFLCFIGKKEADFFLEYRKPDGQIERMTIHLERDKDGSTSSIVPQANNPTSIPTGTINRRFVPKVTPTGTINRRFVPKVTPTGYDQPSVRSDGHSGDS